MKKLSLSNLVCMLVVLCAAIAVVSPAQTFKTILSFNGNNGAGMFGLVQGTDGNFYGTTGGGGNFNGTCVNGCGTVFKITPAGVLTTLYSFCQQGSNCPDGDEPLAGLVQATNGNFYGTTFEGGTGQTACGNYYGCGTIFEITPAGKLTTLYSFCSLTNCADGNGPYAALVQATNGNFYGTTWGASSYPEGYGTVFEITPAGKLTTLYSFCQLSNCADGATPTGALVQGRDGNLYGTTYYGGVGNFETLNRGTIFKITPAGKLTTLYSFCQLSNCADGENPWAGLVQGANGNFYGATTEGGLDNSCYGGPGCGTAFEITPAGKLTTLYSFCSQTNCADGSAPFGLIQATDGNLYGQAIYGGVSSVCPYQVNGEELCGTIFQITLKGKMTTLYSLCQQSGCLDGNDGNSPWWAGLMQSTNGTFYGAASGGGGQGFNYCAGGCGTIFSLSVGLGPFVETLPGADKVGAEVGILGNKLTGATSVTFNGTPASFTVKSPALILSHVPSGATTGTVQVTLPGGTLSSNVPFYVIP